ncbi:MAG: ABC transporter permease [Lachnospiraceae bacterium]|nr:ABC transporter permease [Lachnospiraceae bacterium]
MGYFFRLSFRYIRKNPARTVYSTVGIMLTYIMCFALLTTFYSLWDYEYKDYYRIFPFELYVPFSGDEWTPDMIENAKRMEKDETIEKLTIRHDDIYEQRMVLSPQMKPGNKYALWIKLKDTSDLKASAEELAGKYHFDVHIQTVVAQYLRQDDSTGTALTNVFITLALTVFGGFFVVILRNTMLISVTERVRDHGLLRCVGMSEGQLLALLFTEGILMSLAASLFGTAFAYGGLQLLEPWIRDTLGLSRVFAFGFYPKAVLLTTFLVIAVTVFALIEPGRQAGRIPPLDALHGIYSSMQKRKKKKPASGGITEKVFGAAGFYARRNFKRGRGHQWTVFFAMFFSVTFLLTVLATCESYTETMKKEMKLEGEGQSVYTEGLTRNYREGRSYCDSFYDAEEVDAIREELSGLQTVKDTVAVMEGFASLKKGGRFWLDPHIRELTAGEKNVYVSITGLEAEDMEKERSFLIDGSIDYERMKAEHGILLCDARPEGGRYSDIKAGDTISCLSVEGAFRAHKAYQSAIAAVSEQNGLDAWLDEAGDIVYFENGEKKSRRQDGKSVKCLTYLTKQGVEDTEFTRLQEEVLSWLRSQGIDCAGRIGEDSIAMSDILFALEEMEYEKGYRESRKVMGILSDELLEPVQSRAELEGKLLRVLLPMDSVLEEIAEIRKQAVAEGMEIPEKGLYQSGPMIYAVGSGYHAGIRIRRDLELLDTRIRDRSRELEGWSYENRVMTSDEYFESVKLLKTVRLVVTLLGVFIISICMVQIINTLQANMRLRRKELWLYSVVGMSPADRLKMQLVEHGLSAVLAIGLALLTSFLGSYILIKKLLDWSGDIYVYRWPWEVALLLTGLILGILYAVNMLELRRSTNYVT